MSDITLKPTTKAEHEFIAKLKLFLLENHVVMSRHFMDNNRIMFQNNQDGQLEIYFDVKEILNYDD